MDHTKIVMTEDTSRHRIVRVIGFEGYCIGVYLGVINLLKITEGKGAFGNA